MNRFQILVDKVLNDEHPEPFDYEPTDQAAVEADEYTTPDVGDEDSKGPPS